MSCLTEEQKRRIEENRQRALQLRAAKQKERENQNRNHDLAPITPAQHVIDIPKLTASKPGKPNALSCSRDKSTFKNGCIEANLSKIVGCCSLISRTRFVVDVGYNATLIEVFKTIPSRAYDAKDRKWNFAIQDHELLLQKVKPLKTEVVLSPLPKLVMQVFAKASPEQRIPNVDLSSVDKTLVESLFQFQHDGICFGITKQGRVLLADDMGLGKTIQALGIAAYYRDEWPLLVIAPSSVRYAWQQSFRTWMPSVDPQSICVVDSSKDPIGKATVLIISYDLVVKKEKFIESRDFQVVIADESHFLKSHKASRTRSILPLLKKARRVCLLSGTPALSRPSELFTQLSALCPNLFHSFMDFGQRYCDAKKNVWGYDYSGASNMTELQILMEEVVMIRRLKFDVLAQLPSKRREMVILDPTKIHCNTKTMKAMARQMGEATLSAMERRGALLTYFCETGTAKLDAVCNYLCDLLESEKKFLCFAHHQVVMNGICRMLEEKKCKYIRIDGRTSSEARNQQCEKFQVSDAFRVAVLSITAANMGVTLTAAQLVVFAELFWNPGILTQAEDRAHRIGQMDSVLVQYLVAKNTADDTIWPLVSKKLDVLNKAGLSKDNFRDADSRHATASGQRTLDELFANEDVSWLEDLDLDQISCGNHEEPAAKKFCA